MPKITSKLHQLIFFLFIFHAQESTFGQSVNSLDSNSIDYLLNEAEQKLSTDPVKSKLIAIKAAGIAEDKQDFLRLARCCKIIGTSYYYLGKPDSTKSFWLKSALLLKPYKGKELGDAYNNLGVITLRLGESDSSLFYNEKSLSIRKDVKDTIGVASSFFNLGALHRNFGEFELALEYYLGSLKIYEDLKDTIKIGEVYNSIGLLYLSLKNPELSLEYLFKALEIKEEFSDDRKIANTLNNIAAVYHNLGDFKNAESYYLKAREIFNRYKDLRMLSGIESNLGIIYKEKGNLTKAIESYKNAIVSFEAMKDAEGLASVYNNLAASYYLNKDYSAADASYLKALENAKKINSLPILSSSYQGLFKTSKMLNRYELALDYNEKYVAIHDSIFSQTTAETIAELSEKYESEKKARQIDQLEKEKLKTKQKILAREYFIWIISISAVLCVLILLLILNRYKLKRKVLQAQKDRYQLANQIQEKELEIKNRELTSYATNSLQKGKLFQEIHDQIDSFEFKNNENVFKAEQLKKDIIGHIHSSEDWNKFKIHFESVHPAFFENLKTKTDNLTVNDLKNCAYIQMNLSIKEVAILLNISPKSAKMNRYRLKKKFNLTPEESLSEFIQKI